MVKKGKEKAVGYCRVSTSAQALDGVSLDAQKARIEAWAEANGYELIDVHIDAGLSGSRADNRPALQAALETARREKAALVVYSLSRLARSTKDALVISEKLDNAGADLVSLSERIDTTTAAGKMVFRMLAVLAEFERDLISERTSASMQVMRQRLQFTGGHVRFGYRVGDDGATLVEDDCEQAIIFEARRLRDGGMSLRGIARELSRKGYTSRAGSGFYPAQVKSMVADAA